jgi:hypothetical protein
MPIFCWRLRNLGKSASVTTRLENEAICVRCVKEILIIVSMMSSDNLFIQPHGDRERKVNKVDIC